MQQCLQQWQTGADADEAQLRDLDGCCWRSEKPWSCVTSSREGPLLQLLVSWAGLAQWRLGFEWLRLVLGRLLPGCGG